MPRLFGRATKMSISHDNADARLAIAAHQPTSGSSMTSAAAFNARLVIRETLHEVRSGADVRASQAKALWLVRRATRGGVIAVGERPQCHHQERWSRYMWNHFGGTPESPESAADDGSYRLLKEHGLPAPIEQCPDGPEAIASRTTWRRESLSLSSGPNHESPLGGAKSTIYSPRQPCGLFHERFMKFFT